VILQSLKPNWEQYLFTLAQDASCFSNETMHQAIEVERAQVLREANRACEAITAQNSRSFFLATSLLPGEKRLAMRALYAFCRTADNLADGNVQQPEIQLRQLREGIRGGCKKAGEAVLTAWADISYRYQIPECYAEQLLDGVERDLVQRRYSTFEDLSVYCYKVASTVGLMSMYITGFSSQKAVSYAIKLGVALQLTNILRDVGEDWSAGRLYLPMEELSAFDLNEEDVAAGTVDKRWRAFMRFQIARARNLYAEALPGIAFLHPEGRFAVSAAASLYKGILDDIERHDYDVFNRRAFVNRGLKLKALLSAFWYTQKIRMQKLEGQDFDYNYQGENYGL
jgi:phytoene synthase